MDITEIIAANVKAIREHKKLTLDAAATQTGVSRSMLAQMEKGDVNPTISVLWKIANGYKVSFSSLMENKSKVVSERGKQSVPLVEDDGRFLNYPAFLFDEEKLFESYRIVIKPGGSLSAQPHLKGTEEHITVFAGAVDLTVDGAQYHLHVGDSIRFMADVDHSYANAGEGDALLSMVIYYHR